MADNMASTSHHIATYGPEELKEITGDYTDVLGRGGYGVVYKGKCKDGKVIAVKVLHERPGDKMDTEFNSELELIRKLVHQNIIQLVGYCYKKESEYDSTRGAALCFEYAPNGNLRDYISDKTGGPDWCTRYGIIKGICEGLRYLHHHPSGCFIYHLDLKPENILLSDEMVPKIADFGLSRLYSDHETRITKNNCEFTMRYAPHEFRLRGIRSKSFDIYSLGVLIIEIVAGPATYDKIIDVSHSEIIEHGCKKWIHKLEEIRLYQVKKCLEIALKCSDTDKTERPGINDVIEELNKVEDMIPSIIKSVYHELKNNRASATGKIWDECEGHGKHKQGHDGVDNKQSIIIVSGARSAAWKTALQQEVAFFDSNKYGIISFSGKEADNMGSTSHNTDGEPKSKGFKELQEITCNFSQMLGMGAHGAVYKGKMDGKEIAVKVLLERPGGYRVEFKKEIRNLLKLKHPHITQLLGYSYETEKRLNNFTRKLDDTMKTALCFEYAPNGSLEDYISDEAHGLHWDTCYRIIKGTCEGLNYLHHRPSGPIYHLDLKPENILLSGKSGDMVAKLADFGLSRLFTDADTRITAQRLGTVGYLPPEYIERGIISKEFDIFSLGVIILKLVGGHGTHQEIYEMPHQDIIDNVHKRWMSGLEEAWPHQVDKCLEIGLKCIERDRHKRPKISEIINQLNEVESMREGSVPHQSRNEPGPELSKELGSSVSTSTDDKVILYVQTQGGRPSTVRACNTIRGALQSLHINFIEKDLFDRPDYAEEVEQLSEDMPYSLHVPVLSINGESVGDARELLKLHDDGELAALFQRATLAESSGHLRD